MAGDGAKTVGGAKTIGVVGAGLMGAEIAFVFALAGHRVLLHDRTEEIVAGAVQRLHALYDKGVGRGFYAAADKEAVFGRLATAAAAGGDGDLAAFGDCDVVTEAVFEQEAVKADVLRALDRVCKPGCVITSNTSTIPISTLASFLAEERRAWFIGTHYFSPVSRMKLVEVIPHFGTDAAVVAAVRALCAAAGKTPVLVKDVAGFAVNRLLHAFMIEAVRLVEEGVATPEEIDTACRLGLGHPIGPFELMDATTSSLCLQAQEIMFQAYGERFRPRPLLKQRVQAGFTGGKGRRGWRQRA